MIPKSTFAPGFGTAHRSRLDRNMGVPGITQSNLPEHIANAEVESDEEMGTVVDCGGKDAGEDVCRIKKAEDKQGDGAQALTTQDT